MSLIFILRFAGLCVWIVALAYLSLSSNIGAASGLLGWDKFNHFAAYALLALLLLFALTSLWKVSTRLLAAAWSSAFAYGLLLEGLQWLMQTGRQWESGDILSNALGALAGCVVFRHIARRSCE